MTGGVRRLVLVASGEETTVYKVQSAKLTCFAHPSCGPNTSERCRHRPPLVGWGSLWFDVFIKADWFWNEECGDCVK